MQHGGCHFRRGRLCRRCDACRVDGGRGGSKRHGSGSRFRLLPFGAGRSRSRFCPCGIGILPFFGRRFPLRCPHLGRPQRSPLALRGSRESEIDRNRLKRLHCGGELIAAVLLKGREQYKVRRYRQTDREVEQPVSLSGVRACQSSLRRSGWVSPSAVSENSKSPGTAPGLCLIRLFSRRTSPARTGDLPTAGKSRGRPEPPQAPWHR